MSLSFFQGILSIGVGVTFLQKMSPPRMTPAPHDACPPPHDACPTPHDARPTPHDARKGRHYYTTASQAGACVYSSDDPCGRHGGGACVMRGEAVIIAYTSSSISPAESHHTSTLHRATLLRASTFLPRPSAMPSQSPHNAPVASLAQNLQSHLALSVLQYGS